LLRAQPQLDLQLGIVCLHGNDLRPTRHGRDLCPRRYRGRQADGLSGRPCLSGGCIPPTFKNRATGMARSGPRLRGYHRPFGPEREDSLASRSSPRSSGMSTFLTFLGDRPIGRSKLRSHRGARPRERRRTRTTMASSCAAASNTPTTPGCDVARPPIHQGVRRERHAVGDGRLTSTRQLPCLTAGCRRQQPRSPRPTASPPRHQCHRARRADGAPLLHRGGRRARHRGRRLGRLWRL
jgi:hypothetical protein